MSRTECAAPHPAPPHADDSALLAAIVARDGAAFGELYARYGVLAYAPGLPACWANMASPKDVVQEVFLSIWRRAATFDPTRGNVGAWLLTSVRHAAISRLRGKQGRARFDVPIERIAGLAAWDDPQAAVEAHELREGVRRGLATLPAAQREAIELAYFAGLTCEEIAARTAVALGTAKGRLRLARGRLRTILAPMVT